MKMHGKFIGIDYSDSTFEFYSEWDRADFLKNARTQPNDWYYKNNKVTYYYNKYGHRCKNIEDLDLENYFLFTGCSHGEGSGLELEKSYPYLVSQHFDTDYYNLSIGGSGIDVLEYNIVTWLSTVPKKPKAVIIQWPDHSRFLSIRPGYSHLMGEGSWATEEPISKFVTSAEELNVFSARKKMVNDLLYQLIEVPIFNVQFSTMALANNDEYVALVLQDLARDLSHPGIISNQNTANELSKQMNNKL